jgi:hypothetical protein
LNGCENSGRKESWDELNLQATTKAARG